MNVGRVVEEKTIGKVVVVTFKFAIRFCGVFDSVLLNTFILVTLLIVTEVDNSLVVK